MTSVMIVLLIYFLINDKKAFYDITYVVNHEVQPDARNVLEGSTLMVMFQLYNRKPLECYAAHCKDRYPRVYCAFYHQCIGGYMKEQSGTILVVFHPVKLSDNGTDLSFEITTYGWDLPRITVTGKHYSKSISWYIYISKQMGECLATIWTIKISPWCYMSF